MNRDLTNVSLVLRVRTDSAGRGELIGHAEVVDTGEVVAVHGTAELLALVCRVGFVGGAGGG